MKKPLLFTICTALLLLSYCKQRTETATETTRNTTPLPDSVYRPEPKPEKSPLTEVISFTGWQVTGVTVSSSGRMFANFPRWRKDIPFSVAEILPGEQLKPYPDSAWNSWNGQPAPDKFTCVQSVFAHGNSLFVLDPASPMMQGVVGNAMLYEFDLSTDQLKNKWTFDQKIAPQKSYLNDLRIDDKHGKIYITDSGLGAIIVLDPKTNEMKRLLANHPSTKAEDVVLKIEGKDWLQNGQPPKIHSDGIALSPENDYLFYHALTGYSLYQVPTEALAAGQDANLAKQIKNLGKTPATDGMIVDKAGNLFMADLEKNAIVYRTPEGEIKTLLQHPKLKWPDTFTFDKDGKLLVTTSRLSEATGDIAEMDFGIYKIEVPAK